MKKNIYFILLLGSIGLATHGCGSSGSSSMEMADSNSSMTGVSLLNSKQGQSGGFADADGDGTDDKIVGSPYAAKAANTGVVLIYKGDGMGGYSSSPTAVLTGDDNIGFSFVNMPKGSSPNPDNVNMFALGAIHGSGDGPNDASLCGTVSIYKAGSNGPQLVTKLAGEGPMDKFGYTLAAGDLDGDGYPDLIVGAPFNTPDPSLYQQGAVYVYFGPDFTNRIALPASNANKGIGWAVAAGNVGGDANSDLIIASGNKALVYYGGPTPFNKTTPTVALDAPSAAISTGDAFKALTVIGDLDADGFGEIVGGAQAATANGFSNAGTVVVVKGNTTANVGSAASPLSPVTLLARINGSNPFDRLGASVASVPDMDNPADGKPELVVGATTANADPNYLSGKVYLFKSTGLNLTSKTWGASSVFNGTTKDQSYGYFLASAGGNRLLMGAPRSNMDTGGVSMIDLATGQMVAGGSSGGGSGTGGDCH